MATDPPVIVWFRKDLRLADNPALTTAADLKRPIVALYILDETTEIRPLGAASRWWLNRSLRALEADLESAGVSLILRRGQPGSVLDLLIKETGATAVLWNRLYDVRATERDGAIKARLRSDGLECRSFNAALLNEPWDVRSGAKSAYSVFTPYWRAARETAGRRTAMRAPASLRGQSAPPRSETLEAWRLHPRRPDWSGGFTDWRPGERGAMARLNNFLDANIGAYDKERNLPAVKGTSRLSPHLTFGEIGPRQIWAASEPASLDERARGTETFRKELGWREFYQQLLYHHPRTTEANFKSGFDPFPWRDDPEGLEAWRRGQTGYPIVDAGMRELWATGWMHNRVRMITASFLIKDLLIDWRIGEAWFWDTLVDADLANNVGGWQWVAGFGADAAPYFRIFNPVLQGEKFDPEGAYVRRWAPELARLPTRVIHQPWTADPETLISAGVVLGVTYPLPIVDHRRARERALELYQGLT